MGAVFPIPSVDTIANSGLESSTLELPALSYRPGALLLLQPDSEGKFVSYCFLV